MTTQTASLDALSAGKRSSTRLWQSGVLSLTLARLAISWLLLNDIPKLLLRDGWYFSSGGDENLYYAIGQAIALGHPRVASVAMGQPFVMAALVWLTGRLEYRSVLPWLVIWQGFILAGLSVWVMAHLSYESITASSLRRANPSRWICTGRCKIQWRMTSLCLSTFWMATASLLRE